MVGTPGGGVEGVRRGVVAVEDGQVTGKRHGDDELVGLFSMLLVVSEA